MQSGSRLEPKVMAQMQRALQPILKNVQIDWGTVEATQSPKTLPPIFDNDRLLGVFSSFFLANSRSLWIYYIFCQYRNISWKSKSFCE